MGLYNHGNTDDECPFCQVVQGVDLQDNFVKQSDIFYQDGNVTAFVASAWRPNNPGHAIIIPNQHVENLYNLSFELGGVIIDLARKIAIAFKEVYACEGVSTRQHNEPAGGQNIFHYHMHIFPRWSDDYLYELSHRKRVTTPGERFSYVEQLRQYFDTR